ncbi:hypothetical protein HPB50_001756 [Hyalomma asiaticum]|uniref:Uncharacterized protein n=1 Tax=Hyalomma asiaticum TaxID=266040 RepID=A0ACB7T9W4_HYAAI|nr:hypothetical protein HPB50_001756 [Hyalomma asiaticum]
MAATSKSKVDSEDAGFVDEIRLPCTRHNARVCQLLRRVTTCNEILWHAGLQLKDCSQGDIGDVSIAMVPALCRGLPCCRSSKHDDISAARLVRRLLSAHRCIVSVEMNYWFAKNTCLLKALARSTSVRRISIFGIPRNEPDVLHDLVTHLTSMDAISELVFLDGYEPCEAKMTIPVLLLQQPCTRITKLNVANLEMNPYMARLLIDALIANDTITELVVGTCVFASGPLDKPAEWFVRFLAKEKATLRKLVLRARHFNNTFALQALVEAISSVATLEELVAEWHARSRDCALFANVVSESRSLRSLTLLLGGCCNAPIPLHRARGTEAVDVRPWLLALRDNNVLRNLVLDIPWSTTEQCCFLLRKLPSNHCLENLVLSSLPDDGGLHEVCSIIRQRDFSSRVYIMDHHVGPDDVSTLFACKEATAITVSSKHFSRHTTGLRTTFDVLATCEHITSLSVRCYYFDRDVYASLTLYVKGSSALNELDIVVEVDDLGGKVDDSTLSSSMLHLFRGLSSNYAITKIALEWNVRLNDDHAHVLADAVLNNRRLCELSLMVIDEDFSAAMLDRLNPGLAQNYSITRLHLPVCKRRSAQVAEVQNLVQRNSSLVHRGTRFVLGDHDPYCASAVELVSQHPKVIDDVRREANLSAEGDAVDMIADALRLPCLTNMHEYMKLAGVVRERVVCGVRPDGRMQFDQIYDDCWLRIRHFLRVADIVQR